MTNKEISRRSAIFLVIGLLLVLSLIICIYIVSKESDLVEVKATVVDVTNDKDGTGKNDVTVVYSVKNITYEYNFYYRDDIKVDDVLSIYYHEKNISLVQPNKTSKLIFICPLIGLVLCVYGLFELFTKARNYSIDEEVETKIINENDLTQQYKIITDEVVAEEYVKSPEEEIEVPVKEVKNEIKKSKIIPKSYYVSGNFLVFEEIGKDVKEIDFKNVKEIVKTVNKEGKIVKIVIETADSLCVLTKIKDIKLEELMNTLHNKMLKYNENFMEKVEYKEY